MSAKDVKFGDSARSQNASDGVNTTGRCSKGNIGA